MKCPKCEYLSFESTDRCRNCGYDFSLSDTTPFPSEPSELQRPLDLDRMIGGPLEDLPLFSPALSRNPAGTAARTSAPAEEPAALHEEPTAVHDDGLPLITMPARPLAPLGVRRATPEIPRAKLKPPRRIEDMLFDTSGRHDRRSSDAHGTSSAEAAAAPGRRMAAALIDAMLLFGLDSAVLYFTLRLCNLRPSELFQLPVIPLFAFLTLLNGGYFVAFTAVGGQSIGKMALGIKVVSDENRPVPFGKATLRTLAYLVSALPFGAGFLPGVLGADRLALHDRLSHTRVVRPSSV